MIPNLDEDFWEDLLTLIEEGKVIPVIGAGVVTRGDDQELFYPWLARRLAERLGTPLPTHATAIDLNEVATAHLLNRGDGNALYTRLARSCVMSARLRVDRCWILPAFPRSISI